MSSPRFEAFLARLYVDADERSRFLAAPRATARSAGLNDVECDALAAIDAEGLRLAGESFERKRARHGVSARRMWWRRLQRFV